MLTGDLVQDLAEVKRLYRWEASRVRSRRRAGPHALAAHSRRVAAKYFAMVWEMMR